jgi:hypothetical protein
MDEIYVRYKYKSICFTLFNQFDEKYYQKHYPGYMIMIAAYRFNWSTIMFHPHFNPSHFERLNYRKDKFFKIYYVSFEKTVQSYLPSPYTTDCFDYTTNAINNVWPFRVLLIF